jgi:hypothetical protein
MDNLNNIPNAGNWGDAASKLNDNFNKVKQAVTTIENASKNNKGYFSSLSALNTAFPNPKAGQTAYVYSEASSTKYYIYNAFNGGWVTASVEAPSIGVDISEYTKTGGSTKTTKEVEDEIVQLAGEKSPGSIPSKYKTRTLATLGLNSHIDRILCPYKPLTEDTGILRVNFYMYVAGGICFGVIRDNVIIYLSTERKFNRGWNYYDLRIPLKKGDYVGVMPLVLDTFGIAANTHGFGYNSYNTVTGVMTYSSNYQAMIYYEYPDYNVTQETPDNYGGTIGINAARTIGNKIDGTPDIYDGSYSWWCYPHALNFDGRTHFSYVDRTGAQCIYSGAKDRIIALNTERHYHHDEHNTPAILKMSNGKWIAAYTGHCDDMTLRIRTAWNINSNVPWHGTETLEKSTEHQIVMSGETTYAQIYEYNGKVLILTRTGITESKWQYVYSSDYGKTWGEPSDFMVQGASTYDRVYVIGQHCGFNWIKFYNYYEVQSGDANRVNYFILDINTLIAYDKVGGVQLADLNSAPLTMTQGITIYNAATGNSLRLLDVAGNADNDAFILVADLPNSDVALGKYKHVYFNTSTNQQTIVEIAVHGGYFANTYTGGAYFRKNHDGSVDSNPKIFTSRKEANDWIIEEWDVIDNAAVLVSEIARSSTEQLIRPVPPVGSTNGKGIKVLYIQTPGYIVLSENGVTELVFAEWTSRIKRVYH